MSQIADLNKHLFDQLNRLNNPDLKDAELDLEVKRTKAIAGIAKQVVDAGKLAVSAEKLRQEYRAPAGANQKLLGEL